MCTFSHLHCHTQFSMLDGAAQIKSLIQKSKDFGMPGIAITDHGNMFGVPEFVNEANKNGVKPIIGCEFYLTPTKMSDRANKTRHHQVLLAKNMIGYKNLAKLCSIGYIDGLYYKPRIDKETLAAHSEGLIATTCCLASEINQTIIKKGEAEARKIFEWYLEVFKDDYFIELQRHGLRDQDICNEVLIRWSREYKVPLIATNDSHYVDRDDSEAHDILLALQTNSDLADPNRFRFTDDNNQLNREFYLKTPDEMKELFADVPDAVENTSLVLEKVEPIKLSSDLLLPNFKVPPEFATMDDYLRELTYIGARKRYSEMSHDVVERIESELAIIKKMGFAGYFLIVQGFTTEARNRGVFVGPGRGSAAGSVVAYCIGIINIDPIRYDLLFERFLNPERVSPPDIDIDFDDQGRQAVIDYVVEQYGRENVAQIVTYGTMKAKTAIRDVGRVLGVPLSKVNEIAKAFPDGPGYDTFKKVLDPDNNKDTHELIQSYFDDEDPQVRKMMHNARVLEGSARQTGIHAAGVIIAPGRVYNYVPVALSKDKDVITQYDGPNAEMCGLLKMDFLGLKTLSILKTAIEFVKENVGKEYNLDDIPLTDTKTFELYQRGDTVGTFQFESDGMRKHLRNLKPTNIDDLIAMNALYRPGPMKFIPDYIKRKHGLEKVDYPHESIREILEPTFGIMIYQEQIMKIAQKMANYSLGEADLLRRAMGKKKLDVMAKQEAIFTERAVENGIEKGIAKEVFDKMSMFASYGFNKSHSAAYSVVAYHTGYFKANYPAEYMAAVLTHNMNDIKKVSHFIEDARKSGLPVDAPNINTGAAKFVAKDGRIQYGLAAIKGVGSSAVDMLVENRKTEGEFTSFFNFASRIDPKFVNRKTIESLIQAGAFDCIHKNRAQLLESLDDAMSYSARTHYEKSMQQASLFDAPDGSGSTQEPKLRDCLPWTSMQRLKKERDLIGFYLSAHPLDKFKEELSLWSSTQLVDAELTQYPDREPVRVAGIVTAARHIQTRKGEPMAFMTIEDEMGSIEVIVFAKVYDSCKNLLEPDTLVTVVGTISNRDGVKILADEVDRIEYLREKQAKDLRLMIDIKTSETTKEQLVSLSSILEKHKGGSAVSFMIHSDEAKRPFRMNTRKYSIDPSRDLVDEVKALFGEEAVTLQKK